MSMFSAPPYTQVGSLIAASSGEIIQIETNKMTPNKAVSLILFQLDNCPCDSPLPVLQDCYKLIMEFKNDEEFVRLLRFRVAKLVDRLIIPSLLLYLNNEGAVLTLRCLNMHSPETIPKTNEAIETIQVISFSCQIIKQLTRMGNLKVEFNTWGIILDHLVSCLLIKIHESQILLATRRNSQQAIFNSILSIISNMEYDKDIFNWFLAYTNAVSNEPMIRRLLYCFCTCLFQFLEGKCKFHESTDTLANNCIEILSSTDEEKRKLRSLFRKIEKKPKEVYRSEKKEEAGTVVVVPTTEQESPIDEPSCMNYLPMEVIKAPPPPWLDLFEEQIPEATQGEKRDELIGNNHPHINKLITLWSRMCITIGWNKKSDWVDVEESSGIWKYLTREYWNPIPPQRSVRIPRWKKQLRRNKRRFYTARNKWAVARESHKLLRQNKSKLYKTSYPRRGKLQVRYHSRLDRLQRDFDHKDSINLV